MSTFASLAPPRPHEHPSNAPSSGSESFFDALPIAQLHELDTGRLAGLRNEKHAGEAVEDQGCIDEPHESAGTRLFTITERSSVTTMKTLPPNGTFQRHLNSAQQRQPDKTQHIGEGTTSLKRRGCISLDEQALHNTHLPSVV